MDVHHLKVFVEVFKNKSFSRASEVLSLSQPTVSEHMKKLEEELGVTLFDRAGRTVIPTTEAESIYPEAVDIIEKLQALKAHATGASGVVAGNITIGASTIPGAYLVPPLAARFKDMYPNVSFEVTIDSSKRIIALVASHDILLGFVGAKIGGQNKVEFAPFVEDELIVVAKPGLPFVAKPRKGKLSLEALRELPLLMREEGSGTRKSIDEFFVAKGLKITQMQVVATLGSTDAVKEAAKAGLGASIISRFAVEDELRSGLLERLYISGLNIKRNFYMVKHRHRTLPPNYQAFWDSLLHK